MSKWVIIRPDNTVLTAAVPGTAEYKSGLEAAGWVVREEPDETQAEPGWVYSEESHTYSAPTPPEEPPP